MLSHPSKTMVSAFTCAVLIANDTFAQEAPEPIHTYEHTVTLKSCTADHHMGSLSSTAIIKTDGLPSQQTDKKIYNAVTQANTDFMPHFSQTLEELSSHDITDAKSGNPVNIIDHFYNHTIEGYKEYITAKIKEQKPETPIISTRINVSSISVEKQASSECLPQTTTIEI